MYFFYVVGQNHKDVLIVVDSEDYQAVLEYLKGGQSDQQFRRKLAWKAFQHVAAYDSAVSEWLWKQTEASMWLFLCDPSYIRKTYILFVHLSQFTWQLETYIGLLFLAFSEDKFPPSFTVPLSLKSSLRYGENPHQKAAFYVDKSLAEVNAGGIATAIQHHGKVINFLL